MQDIASFIALNRFGLGVGPGEPEAVEADPKGWIRRQIVRHQTVPAALTAFPSAAVIMKEIHEARLESPEILRQVTGRHYRETFGPEITARARHMIKTDTPFAERMVLFWSNHFTVSRTKAIVGPALAAYEREAIRPHIFGRFADLLIAVASHVGMVSYLDNNVSMGPNSPAGRRTGRALNENLAREILELHTLGVNGGYTQSDVTAFAKALTGWTHGGTVGQRRAVAVSGEFVFRNAMHEPGPKTILGKTYREDGIDEAKVVMHDLARHPSTARFIATKLVRHFVADDPPQPCVDLIADVFQDTDGDLAAISRALVDLEAVWQHPLPKVKTPYELVISTLRALDLDDLTPQTLRVPLATLGQQPFNAPSPQGWPDEARHWLAPEALLRRIEWLRAIAVRVPDTLQPAILLERLIGPVASAETKQMIHLAPSGDAAVALILAAAEFQRR
jgi:uncharacterized protein (DUF1800 family)